MTIKLTITGSNALCPAQLITGVPLDVVLVIDHSGSMESIIQQLLKLFVVTKLDMAKAAAKALIDQLNPQRDHVALVQFGDDAVLMHPLSLRYDDVKKAIDSISGGLIGTQLHLGLARAHVELVSAHHDPAAAQVMIIVSDGRSDPNAALAAGDDRKSKGSP